MSQQPPLTKLVVCGACGWSGTLARCERLAGYNQTWRRYMVSWLCPACKRVVETWWKRG